jgi:hypothetical protein
LAKVHHIDGHGKVGMVFGRVSTQQLRYLEKQGREKFFLTVVCPEKDGKKGKLFLRFCFTHKKMDWKCHAD